MIKVFKDDKNNLYNVSKLEFVSILGSRDKHEIEITVLFVPQKQVELVKKWLLKSNYCFNYNIIIFYDDIKEELRT